MWIFALVGGGVIALASFIIGLFYVISMISGWHLLASRFRATRPPEGQLHRAQTLYGRGKSRYYSGIDMYAAPDGIYLVSPVPVFNWAHPPLFLPWSELHEINQQNTIVRIGVGTPELVQIRIPKSIWAARPQP